MHEIMSPKYQSYTVKKNFKTLVLNGDYARKLEEIAH